MFIWFTTNVCTHFIHSFLTTGNDSEWVDIVEPEIRQILEIERAGKDGQVKVKNTNGQTKQAPSGQNGQGTGAGRGSYNQSGAGRSSQQEEPTSPTSPSKKSPVLSPKMTKNFDLNYGYVDNLSFIRSAVLSFWSNGFTPIWNRKKQSEPTPGTSSQAAAAMAKNKSPRLPTKVHRSNSNSGSNQRLNAWSSRQRLSNDKGKSSSRKDLSLHKKLSRHAMSKLSNFIAPVADGCDY